MKCKVLGSRYCVDTRDALDLFKEKGIEVDFHDFSDNMDYLREFLFLRDENPLFQEVIANKKIGIPCMVLEDGTITLDVQEAISLLQK